MYNKELEKIISEKDFHNLIDERVIGKYKKAYSPMTLSKFAKNGVDYLEFYTTTSQTGIKPEEWIKAEIERQRQKTIMNAFGLFWQYLFSYIANCIVPQKGWDVIFSDNNVVEMKNKHNTMNSSSATRTFQKMDKFLIENPGSTCYLVEVIAKVSQDIEWRVSIDGSAMSNPNIRRISMDKWLEKVTGRKDAMKLIIDEYEKYISQYIGETTAKNDTVITEMLEIYPDITTAIKDLSFGMYDCFKK